MTITLETERPSDADCIRSVTAEAFQGEVYSSGREPAIVDDLRAAGALTVSLVARMDGEVIGHIAASPLQVEGKVDGWFGLGPLSVAKKHQRKGVGSLLMRATLERLKSSGAKGCVLVGHPQYYQRFGFKSGDWVSVNGVPSEVTMAIKFHECANPGVVRFHDAFGVH